MSTKCLARKRPVAANKRGKWLFWLVYSYVWRIKWKYWLDSMNKSVVKMKYSGRNVVKPIVVLVKLDVKLVSKFVRMTMGLDVKMESQLELKMVQIVWIWRKVE
jgi:hypothetical protein